MNPRVNLHNMQVVKIKKKYFQLQSSMKWRGFHVTSYKVIFFKHYQVCFGAIYMLMCVLHNHQSRRELSLISLDFLKMYSASLDLSCLFKSSYKFLSISPMISYNIVDFFQNYKIKFIMFLFPTYLFSDELPWLYANLIYRL